MTFCLLLITAIPAVDYDQEGLRLAFNRACAIYNAGDHEDGYLAFERLIRDVRPSVTSDQQRSIDSALDRASRQSTAGWKAQELVDTLRTIKLSVDSSVRPKAIQLRVDNDRVPVLKGTSK